MNNETLATASFTDIEREAIILNAVRGMIDDMVNRATFVLPGEGLNDTNLLPTTAESLRQFGTLLRDFLSPIKPENNKPLPFDLPKPQTNAPSIDHTTLFYLRLIAEGPLIGKEIEPLSVAVRAFSEWLEAEALIPNVWLPSIGAEVNLKIKRIDFINISGDMGKHSFLRLARRIRKIRAILSSHGVNVDDGEVYMILPDLWYWFHTHLLAYHSSTIAEFLNNIRYAIRDYIAPIADSSLIRIDELVYIYQKPDDVTNKFAISQYNELLHYSLSQPYFPRFSVTNSLKSQF